MHISHIFFRYFISTQYFHSTISSLYHVSQLHLFFLQNKNDLLAHITHELFAITAILLNGINLLINSFIIALNLSYVVTRYFNAFSFSPHVLSTYLFSHGAQLFVESSKYEI